nr:hypothetical protein [Bacillus sp. AFS059628]
MLNRVKHKPIMAKIFFSARLPKEITDSIIAITAEANMQEAKVVLYQIWISTNKDKIEIKAGDNRYAQLEGKYAATLFRIVTGEKLGE